MNSKDQICAKDEARRCRELEAELGAPAERAVARNVARGFDELANRSKRGLAQGAGASITALPRDHVSMITSS